MGHNITIEIPPLQHCSARGRGLEELTTWGDPTWGAPRPPPVFLSLSVSHFDTNRQTETCVDSRPANKPTNSGTTKPDHRCLAWDHRRPRRHVLWAPLTYPWKERAQLMRGWEAAVDVGCGCVFLFLYYCVRLF